MTRCDHEARQAAIVEFLGELSSLAEILKGQYTCRDSAM
jgi:hypothetical protein